MVQADMGNGQIAYFIIATVVEIYLIIIFFTGKIAYFIIATVVEIYLIIIFFTQNKYTY